MHFKKKGGIFVRKIKRITATFLACVMIFAVSITASAADGVAADGTVAGPIADGDSSDDGITPRKTKTLVVGDGYKNMTGDDLRAPHGNGWFYYEVTGSGYNGWVYQIDCLMYDSNGNVVWRGDNICGVAADGKLEYGGNVVRIDLRIAPRLVVTPVNYYKVTVTY